MYANINGYPEIVKLITRRYEKGFSAEYSTRMKNELNIYFAAIQKFQ